MPLALNSAGGWQQWISLEPLPINMYQPNLFNFGPKLVLSHDWSNRRITNWLVWNDTEEKFDDTGLAPEIPSYASHLTLPRSLVPGCSG